MALPPVTPRDHLQRLVDLGRKTLRYWWLVAVFAVVGSGLSLAFALTRPRKYQSWSTLFYQERIRSQLVSPNQEEVALRNIGERYRELLFARPQLDQIISDPDLDPYPRDRDPELKFEKLRQAVRLQARGANVFRILFTDSDPERAKRVTDRLTQMLRDKDVELRNDQAIETLKFITDQQEKARAELKQREEAYTAFLAKHPEFIQDAASPQTDGASIRAIHSAKPSADNSRLLALERQRQRIRASLDARPEAAASQASEPKTPERIAAEAAVQEAQRELAAAQKELQAALTRFTEKHPTVVNARERVEMANQRLRQARAAVPPDAEPVVRAASPADRDKLKKELEQIEKQIAAEQSRTGRPGSSSAEDATSRVVQLEGAYNALRRAVTEQRERVESLAERAFRAQIDANQKAAEQGGRLAVVDPAFKPARPTGPGKTIFLLAGMVLFLGLGTSLAVGLAVIDDRVYRRADLDSLGIAVLAVIPPAVQVKRKRKAQVRRRGGGGV